MNDRQLSAAADLVLDAPDARLRHRATALMWSAFGLGLGLSFDLFDRLGEAVVSAILALSVVLVLIVLLVMALARQRTWIVTAASTVLVARRVLGLAWQRERIAFDRVEEVQIFGDTAAVSATGTPRRRSVHLVLRSAQALLVRTLGSSREAEELASRLASMIGRPMGGTTPELEAGRLVGSTAPPELRSAVSRRGDKLRITIDPHGQRAQGTLFFTVCAFAIAAVGTTALLLLFAADLGLDDSFWLLLIGTLLGMAAGLIIVSFFHRNRYAKLTTIQASPGRLEIRRPRWTGPPRNLLIIAADQPRIEVEGASGPGTPGLALLVEANGRELRLGRSLSDGELAWIAEAVRAAFAGDQPPLPAAKSPTAKGDGRREAAAPVTALELEQALELELESESPDEGRWHVGRLISLFFFLTTVGTVIAGLLQAWWVVLGFLALVALSLGSKNAKLWWRKRWRVRAGHDAETFAAHFAGLPVRPELLERIYQDLSQAGEFVSDVPVLPSDRLGHMLDHDVDMLKRFWIDGLAEIQGVEPPTDDELVDVETVADLVRLLAA